MSQAVRDGVRLNASISAHFRRGRPENAAATSLAEGILSGLGLRHVFVSTASPEPPGTELTILVAVDGRELTLCGQVVAIADSPPYGPGMRVRLGHDHRHVTAEEVLQRVHFKSAAVMTEVPDGAVQLAVLGPPRLEGDAIAVFRQVMAEVRRKLRPDGVVAMWNSDHYKDGRIVLTHDALRTVLDGVGLSIFDHKVLLRRPKADRTSFAHLQLFSGERQPQRYDLESHSSGIWIHPRAQAVGNFEDALSPDASETLVRAFTRPGDLVLAPFAGSGTNIAVALGVHREAVGYEINPAMREIMVERTRQLESFYSDTDDAMTLLVEGILRGHDLRALADPKTPSTGLT